MRYLTEVGNVGRNHFGEYKRDPTRRKKKYFKAVVKAPMRLTD